MIGQHQYNLFVVDDNQCRTYGLETKVYLALDCFSSSRLCKLTRMTQVQTCFYPHVQCTLCICLNPCECAVVLVHVCSCCVCMCQKPKFRFFKASPYACVHVALCAGVSLCMYGCMCHVPCARTLHIQVQACLRVTNIILPNIF